MRKRWLAGAVATVFVILLTACRSTSSIHADARRVLFVGNSLTYYNDLPAMFASIHRNARPDVTIQTELLATGGGSLRERLDDGLLGKILQQGRFDLVFLQDVGGWPLCADADHRCADSEHALAEAVALVRAAHAQPVWYAGWQRLPAAQHGLTARVEATSNRLGLEVADVGHAMQAVNDRAVRDRLLLADGHPAALGSWLAAAALYVASAPQPLSDATPGRSCGIDWEGHHLSAGAVASAQQHAPTRCHAITDSDWQAIRRAVLSVRR